MALLGISGRRGPWFCEGSMPSVGKCQGREVEGSRGGTLIEAGGGRMG